LELSQVGEALVSILFCATGFVIFASFGLMALSVLFVIYAWPTLGMWSLLIVAGFYWLIAIVLLIKIWDTIHKDKLKLKITMQELSLDRAALFPKDAQ